MDATTAFSAVLAGIRKSYGDFPPPRATSILVPVVAAIADALAEVAREDAYLSPDDDHPDVALDASGLLRRAIDRRVNGLFADRATRELLAAELFDGDAVMTEAILLPDGMFREFARRHRDRLEREERGEAGDDRDAAFRAPVDDMTAWIIELMKGELVVDHRTGWVVSGRIVPRPPADKSPPAGENRGPAMPDLDGLADEPTQ